MSFIGEIEHLATVNAKKKFELKKAKEETKRQIQIKKSFKTRSKVMSDQVQFLKRQIRHAKSKERELECDLKAQGDLTRT